MSTVTMTRDYPIDRTQLYLHLTPPTNWPSYYHGMIDVVRPGPFTDPGDQVAVTHRLLGRTFNVEVTLLEMDPPNRIRLRAKAAGLPTVEHEWIYSETAAGTEVTVTLDVAESDSWLGRAIDRHVLPRQLERDVARTLDNLDELVAVGLDTLESR